MADLPDHPTCTIRSGERVQLKHDRIVLPDGSTRTDLLDCKLEAGSIMVVQYDEPSPPRRKHAKPPTPEAPPTEAPPTEATPTDEAHDVTQVAVVEIPTPPKPAPPATIDPVMVALAVGAVGAAGALGLRRMKTGKARVQTQQQRQEEQERKECSTRSDDVLLDFRARTADLHTRKLAEVVEPVELWRRADSLDEDVASLQKILQAKPRRR